MPSKRSDLMTLCKIRPACHVPHFLDPTKRSLAPLEADPNLCNIHFSFANPKAVMTVPGSHPTNCLLAGWVGADSGTRYVYVIESCLS